MEQGRENNFDFMRCLAAFSVVYGHSAVLIDLPDSLLWSIPISAIGVMIFFSISGYLVAESWQRDPRLLPFLSRRSLRIFPALIVCVIITTCVFGVLATTLPLYSYFSDAYFLAYFKNIALVMSYYLPGTFETNPYKYIVNGSLWTLPVEFLCYVSIAVVSMRFGQISIYALIPVTLLTVGVNVVFTSLYTGPPIIILGTSLAEAATVMPCFFVGSLLCVMKNHIQIRFSAAIILIFCMFSIDGPTLGQAIPFASLVAVPYITMAVCLHAIPILRRWGRFGDFSYGVYLYAFPIQQLLIHLSGNQIGFPLLLVSTTVCAFGMAWCSWHLVERRALAFKPRQKANRLVDALLPG